MAPTITPKLPRWTGLSDMAPLPADAEELVAAPLDWVVEPVADP